VSNRIDIAVPGRLRTRKYRRDLPASWQEVEEARRLPLLTALLTSPDVYGQVEALRRVLHLPREVFASIPDDTVVQLLDLCPWMDLQPNPRPCIDHFDHAGKRYYLPREYGINLVAIEYPLADEALVKFMRTQDPKDLTMLCAVLCREENPNADEARTRGDQRTPLRSRWEAEARAREMEHLSIDVALTVLLYFAGVKEFVHRSYGAVLFEKPDDTDDDNNTTTPDSTLGWWGIYFQVAADGPFGDIDRLYQTPFHDVCIFLVDRIRQQKEQARAARLNNSQFGKQDPEP